MPTARITRPSRTKSPTRNSDQVNCLRCAIRNLLRAAPELEERTASEGGHNQSRPNAKSLPPQEHSLKSELLERVLPDANVHGPPTCWDNYTRFKSKNVADTDPWKQESRPGFPQSKPGHRAGRGSVWAPDSCRREIHGRRGAILDQSEN